MSEMDYLERDIAIEDIVERYLNFEISRSLAVRELKNLGLSNDQILYAIGEEK